MPSSTLLKFSLEIGALGAEKFRVLEFTLTEAISEGFHLRIEASCSDADVKYADMIGKDATLTVTGEDFPVSHFGVVTGYNQHPDASESFGQENVLYDIVIEPHAQFLAYTTQNRVFQNLDVKAIVTKVAADGGVAANFKFAAKGPFLEREYTVQYNETDLDFIKRLLEEEGISYYFDHEGSADVFTMIDKATDVRPCPENAAVEFIGNAGLSHMSTDHVSKMVRTRRMITGKVTLKDYNDRTPEVKLQGSAANPGQGEHYTYGPMVSTTAEADRLASLRSEMLASSKEVLEGEGICRGFRAGYRFELTEGGPSLFAGKYTLVRVVHHGDQREGFESDAANIIYTNSFSCIPAATVFRPAQVTPRPKIYGIITAKVDGQAGPYAYLDEEGRYHAKMPFDRTDLTDGGATLPIRMSQPYGGPNYGMHFPVHNGNDIVLGFVDGDVDRPIALGTVPNPSNGSPVTSKNKSESVIKTASGHILRMDDKEGETIVDLNTAGKHLLAMDDKPASKQIKIKTSGGHLFILDDAGKNATLLTTAGHTIKIDDAANSITIETKGGHSMVMDDPGKKIEIKDGQGVNAILMDGGGKLLHLSSTGDVKIDAGKNMILTAKEAFTVEAGKDMSFHADGGGSITVDKAMVHEAVKDFTVKAKKIGITSETDFIVAAKKMDFKADNDFKVDAGKVNIKASGDVILKGSKIAQN